MGSKRRLCAQVETDLRLLPHAAMCRVKLDTQSRLLAAFTIASACFSYKLEILGQPEGTALIN